MQILSILARSKSALLSPDRNPLLRYVLKKTFYAQFCAGETAVEVKQVVKGIKSIGFSGVILGHAREVVLKKGEIVGNEASSSESSKADVDRWRQGTLDTLKMIEEGDEVALKFTGAGRQALHALQESLPPSKFLEEAIVEICELAKARQVRLLFDAEQHSLQAGIDAWTLDFQERYNQDTPGQALVYGTYQAYKCSTPTILAGHLSTALDKGFTLGVKLVRGAYLGSDPRHLFWSQKEETDEAYDDLAEALMRRTYSNLLRPVKGKENSGFPQVSLVLATHNLDTVMKAIDIRKAQLEKGEDRVPLTYAQLQGMADNVSCELVHAGKLDQALHASQPQSVEAPQVYKYLVWGTVGECLTYLLRRAQENKDTVTRTEESRLALRSEVGRRVFGA
ncbi:proline dehydrogenase [Trapelia coarctata]|nr:proline dehydrogenase [Trapelia coarctata]